MKNRCCVLALLAAAAWSVSFGAGDSSAFGPRRTYWAPSQAGYYYSAPVYMYYNPYVLPLPAYGIMPLPLASDAMRQRGGYWGQEDDFPGAPRLDTPPKKRANLFPAVPFGPTTEEPTVERRVRFEITVPHPDAILTFNGVATKEKGLTRIVVTPPLDDDKGRVVRIEASWTEADGTPSAVRRVEFTVVAGQTRTYTFK